MSDTIRININPASNVPYELTPDQLLNVGINPALFRGEPGTSGKSPYIGDDNYWYEYDDEAQQWVKTDVYADEAAAEVALAAAQRADSAAQGAEAAIESANAAAESATQTAEDAKTRTDEALAQAKRTLDSAVSSAEESVQKAVADANTAASTATSAASEATTQAAAAEQAATDANAAIDDAQSAAQAATDATQKALDAADRANQAASGLGLQKEVLDHVPEPSEMVENVIYLVPAEEPNPENVYNEYMLIDGQRELIGSTATNLTDYVKSDELNSTLENYAEKSDLETKADLIEGKVDPAQLPDHLIVGHEGELPPVELGINADTLQGHNADYFAPKDALDNKSDKVEIIELSIPNNGWESADDELYRVVIENENIHAKDVHIADLKQSGDEVSDKTAREAWAKITRITAAEGSATVYASESLESVITMELATWADAVNKGGAVESEVFIVRRGIVGGGRSAISIESAVVTLDTDSWTYDKTEHCPKVISVMFEGIPLTENRDYVVMSVPQTNAGNYNVHVLGILAYDGVANAPWRIDKAQGTISVEPQSIQITGEAGTEGEVALNVTGDGDVSASESSYVTARREGNKLKLVSVAPGSDTLTITLAETENYTGATCTLQVEVITKTTHIWGVTWDGTGSKWQRTDDAVDFPDPVPYHAGMSGSPSSPFDDIDPWKTLKDTTTDPDCGSVQPCQKFWYELKALPGGGLSLRVADGEVEGFVVDPAHMRLSDSEPEVDTVLIGTYHCADGTNKSETGKDAACNGTRSAAREKVRALGDHVEQHNFITRFSLWLLYLVEMGDWNGERIGRGCSDVNNTKKPNGQCDSIPYHTGTTASSPDEYGFVKWRNIAGLWDTVYDWLDGCYYDANGLNIILDPAKYSDSENGVLVGKPTSGYPSKFTVSDAAGFPMFYPTESSGSVSTGSCDGWYVSSGSNPCLCAGGYSGQNQDRGPFYVSYNGVTNASGSIGWRLQKRVPSGGV